MWRYFGPALVVLLPLVVGGIYRYQVVAPRERVERLAGEVGQEVRAVLAETSLPGLSFPGAKPALAVASWSEPVAMSEQGRGDLELECDRLASFHQSIAAVPAVGRALGLCGLLLGDDAAARRSWERVEVHGEAVQVAEARVGLALLLMKHGRAAEDPQDRAFAWDRSQALLELASPDLWAGEAARANLAALAQLRASPRESPELLVSP